MLVLTRRQGESIIIGEGIKLTVVSVGPGRVKIGITAPDNIRIDREEIHSRKQQEQLQLDNHENGTDVLSDVSSSKLIEDHSGQNTMTTSTAVTCIINRPMVKNHNDEPHVVTSASPTTSTAKAPKYQPPRNPR
jgi:carbon storage regulator